MTQLRRIRRLFLEQFKLAGGQPWFAHLRNRPHFYILQLGAFPSDNGHDTLLTDEKFMGGEQAQRIIETEALHLRPIIVTAAQSLVTQCD